MTHHATLDLPAATANVPARSGAAAKDRSPDPIPDSITSDEIAIEMARRDYRKPNGMFDYTARSAAFTLGSLMHSLDGIFHSHKTIADRIGVSTRTFIRTEKVLQQHWKVTRRAKHQTNVYSTTGISKDRQVRYAQEEKFYTSLPTKISVEAGFTPVSDARRRRQEIEGVAVPDDEWTIPGTFDEIDQFLDPELSLTDKVRLAGIGRSNQLVTVVGGLRYENETIRGFSITIALYWFQSTGWASVSADHFDGDLTRDQITSYNAALIRSGLWRIDRDLATGQNVYTPTALLFAQTCAYWKKRALKQANGRASGYQISLVNVCSEIGGIVAANATRIGVNDQIGTPGSDPVNSTVSTATYARAKVIKDDDAVPGVTQRPRPKAFLDRKREQEQRIELREQMIIERKAAATGYSVKEYLRRMAAPPVARVAPSPDQDYDPLNPSFSSESAPVPAVDAGTDSPFWEGI